MNVRRSFSQPPQTLVDLLRQRVDDYADDVLYRFLRPGLSSLVGGSTLDPENKSDLFNPQVLTYLDLERRAKEVATWLLGRVEPGDRVVLAFPPGCEYITGYFGCLYAGVIAVPAYPPRRNQRDQRLHAIIADADVRVALTTEGLLESVTDSMSDAPQVTWHSIESIPQDTGLSDQWVAPKIDAASLAFLQYTSGSTGTPKGVMVTHGNLVHNQKLIQSSFQSDHRDSLIGWLPLHHDMGLIGNVMHPLHLGGSLTFMSPIDFLQKPARWLQAISHYKGTIGGGPNFAFRLCAEQISDAELEGVDLSLWRVAFNGAEPIDADVLDQFAERFQSVGFEHKQFSPCYGMAETTLLITSKVREQPVRLHTTEDGSKTWVGCGAAREDMDIRIVDPELRTEVSPGKTGEIWINGPSVAAGYWKKPEQTQQTFEANIVGSSKPYLRTGDLGWVDPNDDELFVTGRCKDLIIVRGANFYPQDIEQSSESAHAACAVGGCAAFSVDRDGEECLVIAQEVRRSARRSMDATEVVDAIRDRVFDKHELPPVAIVLLRPSALPKTTSGKVQRREAQRQFLAGELRQEYSWDVRDAAANAKKPADQPNGWTQTDEYEPIAKWLTEQVSKLSKLPAETIDLDEPISRYGLNSVGAVRLAGEVSEWLGRDISPTLAYEYPTISALAGYLSGSKTDADTVRSRKSSRKTDMDDIAIVGIGCRFPMADSPEGFWNALMSGTDAITDRADHPNRFRGQASDLDDQYFRAGYLREVDQFDAAFFGISPREADAIDPQHRLLLETTYEAVEDAGIPIERLRGQRVGVFVGSSHQDYLRLGGRDSVNAYSASGNSSAMAAGRLSYTFDFRGPSLTIDTACSSSLVAIHQAIRAMRSGECDYAIAGGVNLILSSEATESFAKAGMLSPTGVCRTFDDAADGFVRGEGAGMILLRPLKDAIANGDRIYGVLKGSAVNQDGRTNGLTAPSRIAQTELIREAVADSRLAASDIEYVEAHGTGTSLGDPIELRAIREALRGDDAQDSRPLSVGSIKANIGHLEAAAGIAGLIKVALSMRHGNLPPQIHFDQPNSRIDWNDTISVPVKSLPWDEPNSPPRRAGVSSFGFSGTNAHVIIEQFNATESNVETSVTSPVNVFVTSAKTEESLKRRMVDVDTESEQCEPISLAYTLASRRSHHRYRAARVNDSGDASWILGVGHRDPHVDFYFTGQGGVQPNAGRWLYEKNSVFAEHFDALSVIYASVTGDQLKDRLWGDESAWMNTLIQPAIYSLQIALACFWESIGVQIHRVVGHSLGEYGAAAVAGVFSVEDGMRLVTRRAELAGSLSVHGGMLAVFAGEADLQSSLKGVNEEWDLAVVNGPRQTVIAGLPDALKRIANQLKNAGITSRAMSTTHGFHSRLIDPMLADFDSFASTIEMKNPNRTMVSSQTGLVVGDEITKPAYWRGNLRNAVRFDKALETLSENLESEGVSSLGIEIGAGSTLASLARAARTQSNVLPGLQVEAKSQSSFNIGLAKLYVHGVDFDWSKLIERPATLVSLPSYPFDRQRHWIEELSTSPDLLTNPSDPISQGFPGQQVELATDDVVYQTTIVADSYLADHEVAGSVVFPAAGFIWWAYQATIAQLKSTGSSSANASTISLTDFKISQAIRLKADERRSSQLVLSPVSQSPNEVYRSHNGMIASKLESGWQHHAKWMLCDPSQPVEAFEIKLSQPQRELLQSRCIDSHYDELAEAGLKYGPAFRCIRKLNASGKWAEAIVAPDSDKPQMVGLLDSCFQVIASLGQHWGSRTWVPVAADRIDLHGPISNLAESQSGNAAKQFDVGINEKLAVRALAPVGSQHARTVASAKTANKNTSQRYRTGKTQFGQSENERCEFRVQAHLTSWSDETATADVWIRVER